MLNAHGAGALPHNCDLLRISSECRNIMIYPFQSRKLVIKSIVSAMSRFFFKFRKTRKTKRSKTIVYGNRNNPFFRPDRVIKRFFMSAAAFISAAMYINENRKSAFFVSIIRRPYIQKKAVFAVIIRFALTEFVIIKNLLMTRSGRKKGLLRLP